MRRLVPILSAVLLAILNSLSGCNQGDRDPERYVLTGNDNNLFFQKQLVIDPKDADVIIAIVQAFSREHGMDFLLARESLPPGDFNVSANGPTLNIKAIHSAAIGDEGVQVFAIVPKTPTTNDRALVAEFVTKLEEIR
jgi:hypothetical protein